ncbi:MAG: DUF4160 domain-containing protein [Clostridia bacterium]|nr:DUF4160 domain-containing protein [Clostridia bacterium]
MASLLNERVRDLLHQLQLADLQVQTSPGHLVFLVARVKNARIEIYPRDHNPPHFHVKINGGEYSASYNIKSLERLAGDLPSHLEREVLKWARANQTLLMQTWELTRPTVVTAGTDNKELGHDG